MIHTTLPTRRKPVEITPVVQQQSSSIKGLFAEAARRDAIIKRLFAGCKLTVGQQTKPYDDESCKKWGEDITVVSVCDSYAKMGKSEVWPPDDVPLIVHVYSNTQKRHFFCTPGFLEGGT